VFDGTFGLGGHAEAVLEEFPNIKKYIACDLDRDHLIFGERRLKKWLHKLVPVCSNFSEIKKIVQNFNLPRPLAILLDLGLCSSHVDDPEKGFSFATESPLQMSFGEENRDICSKIVNEWSEYEISNILTKFGEEPHAIRIARAIILARANQKITTTTQLREIVEKTTSSQNRKKTVSRVFQSLRIAVNDELEILKKALDDAIEIMKSGDRIGVISYHSLEDRIVKRKFRDWERGERAESKFSLHELVSPPRARILTKKPVLPGDAEIAKNPRSRSAKLRIAERI